MSFIPSKTFFRTIKPVLALTVGIMLVGCESNNPMSYLPEATGGYMGINMDSVRESKGFKRLREEMEKYQPGAMDLGSDKAQKIYVAFDMPEGAGTKPPSYGVAVGMPGMAEDVVSQYKAAGATEGKTAGHETYTSGSVMISPVGKAGILIYPDTSTLERMVAVSKKKQTGASESPEFAYVSSSLSDHAVVVASKAQPLLKMAGPMLGPLQQTNPQAAEAINAVTMLSISFNWDDHPVIDVMLHVPDKAKSDVLAGTINGYLTIAKNLPTVTGNPTWAKVVQPLQATSAEDGVTLKIDIPADVAEQLFSQIETMRQSQNRMRM